MADSGIPLLAQTVLLANVNDTPEVMAELMRAVAFVAPVVAYLCTEEVPDTASVFIVGGGKVQRAALFQNEGVTFDNVPTVQMIRCIAREQIEADDTFAAALAALASTAVLGATLESRRLCTS